MMRFLNCWLISFISLIVAYANAQSSYPLSEDSFKTKMAGYDKAKGDGQLFVHFDKNIYLSNENVWLTAYFLQDIYGEKRCFISVVLVDDHNLIKIQEKFLMVSGVSSGKILLPDSLKEGDYHFVVYYGDVVKGKPVNAFVQPVAIKKPSLHYFTASLIPVERTAPLEERSESVQLTIKSKGENPGADIPVYYYVGDPINPLFSGKFKTNKAGQCFINIPSKYLTNDNHVVQLELTYPNETKHLKYTFPGYAHLISAKFYPEGGSLIAGFPNNVGWEAKDETGNPVKTTGVLYKNNQPTDTITTNIYGMGSFNFIPETNNTYFVRLPYSNDKNVEYQLPEVLVHRPVITIYNAIANDTLSVIVKNRKPENFYVLIHDRKQLFSSFFLRVDATGRSVKIALTDLPKGIAEITLLDSLKRPCAERLFFAHYDLNNKLNINTNQSSYKTREKILLDIQLKEPGGKPITGLVSIACVQANRVSSATFKRIDSYLYLVNELGKLPFKENYLGSNNTDKDFLEDILLIRGWRNYPPTDTNNIRVTDTLTVRDSTILTGEVSRFNKPLKKAVSVFVMKGSSLTTIETSATGRFLLNIKDLLVNDGKNIRLFVSGSHPEEYKISITDPFQIVIDSLTAGFISGNATGLNLDHFALSGQMQFGGPVSLSEVKIRGRNDNSFYGSSKTQNPCGDYACLYGFLNCPLHAGDPDNRPPLKGKIYKNYLGTDADGKEIFTQTLYSGCEVKKFDFAKVIDGISYPVEFYPVDYGKDSTVQPQFLSTIYWKNIYKLPVVDGKPLEFYTGDITGEFKIIVQGITDNDLIYGEQTFKISE